VEDGATIAVGREIRIFAENGVELADGSEACGFGDVGDLCIRRSKQALGKSETVLGKKGLKADTDAAGEKARGGVGVNANRAGDVSDGPWARVRRIDACNELEHAFDPVRGRLGARPTAARGQTNVTGKSSNTGFEFHKHDAARLRVSAMQVFAPARHHGLVVIGARRVRLGQGIARKRGSQEGARKFPAQKQANGKYDDPMVVARCGEISKMRDRAPCERESAGGVLEPSAGRHENFDCALDQQMQCDIVTPDEMGHARFLHDRSTAMERRLKQRSMNGGGASHRITR